MKERLHKVIARAGLASRRAAERQILEGRVRVDGVVVTQLGASADPDSQDIRVDGTRVRVNRPRRYLLLNKPTGYLATRSDPEGRKTVMELLPPSYRALYPVGRLDYASSGLLLITDDGALAQGLAHPSYRVPKTYRVVVRGVPDQQTLARASRGIWVEGDRVQVERSVIVSTPSSRSDKLDKSGRSKPPKTRLRVVLRQGKNREIRRLFKALGHPVLELHREKIATLTDRGLRVGAFRKLEPVEILGLKRAIASKGAVRGSRASAEEGRSRRWARSRASDGRKK